MKKKFIVGLVLVLVLIANVNLVAKNQQMIARINTQEAEALTHKEEIAHNIQTIKEMERYIWNIQNEKDELLEELEAKEEKIKSLELRISQYMESTPKIIGVRDESKLKRGEDSEQLFYGTIRLSWDDIPNASGYQIEFNYKPSLEETEEANYYRSGAFYSYKVDISDGLKFRVRAYEEQNSEKVYSEFSKWFSLDVE
ncbi:MAG: hypothetical protein HFJ32_03485 [Clostridia bacterium]|nr:hypothetical protein [Clostridia bacterium]